MKIKSLIPFVILYSIVALIEMWGEWLFHGQGSTTVLFIAKPLLMPVLILFLWVNTKFKSSFDKLILLGLIFGWMGDILLMFNKENLFVFGLASFLICHLFYIAAFINNTKKSGYKLSFINKFVLALIPLFYLIVLYSYIFPHINSSQANRPFLIPVSVYALTIVTMSLFALWRIGSTNKWSAGLIIMGAFTFVVSDSLIAINKFVAPLTNANLLIMLTYCLAQIWIVIGTIQHHLKLKK